MLKYVVLTLAIINAVAAWRPNNNKIMAELNAAPKSPPVYTSYIVSGFLDLPYAEIREQFTAYYDPKGNRSRIDYYDGLVKTVQRADTNNVYKLAYMTTEEVLNQMNCFQLPGDASNPVAIQSALPDLAGSGFKYIGQLQVEGHMADQWQLVEIIGTKKNKYTFLADSVTGEPFSYEMDGYDSLFGSHFDKYVVEYKFFSPTAPADDVFQIPADMTCHGFPGPGAMGTAEQQALMNPMAEFINRNTGHIDEMFNGFKIVHKKDYQTAKEQALRKSIFHQNVRLIHSTNRAGLSYNLAINHLADRTDSELKALRGFRRTSQSPNGQAYDPKVHTGHGMKVVPDTMDWRLYGAVVPVKDQAVCGSCWTFGTTGTIEGAYFLKTGNLVRLSQQELIDCSWGEGNNGCDGGEDFRAYDWIMRHGLASEESYGHYLAVDGMCKAANTSVTVQLKGYVNVTSGDQTALKTAIATNGPISVAIDASHKSFSFYANGVYYEPACGSGPDSLDHAVLAVGYGTMNGQAYWLVKNSWSTYWGNDGYVLMSQKDNNCGVATAATFVQV